jgi:hypothetical protein
LEKQKSQAKRDVESESSDLEALDEEVDRIDGEVVGEKVQIQGRWVSYTDGDGERDQALR